MDIRMLDGAGGESLKRIEVKADKSKETKPTEMREEAVKALYVNGHLVGFAKMNGTLKFYKAEEIGYGDIDQLFSIKSAI